MYSKGFTDEENAIVINRFLQNKEEYLEEEFFIVCAENGTEDIIYGVDWHRYVEVDGDKRIFRYYSDYVGGTRYYSRIVWEKGKGIVYYVSGEGSMLMHVEFGLELDR